MDDYLDMLIEDSSKAAKAALIYSMFPWHDSASKKVLPALKKLDASVLDSAIQMLSTSSAKQIDYVHYAMKLSAISQHHSDRSALLYSAALAPLIEAFRVEDAGYFDWYMEMLNVTKFIDSKVISAGDVLDIDSEISLARGALIAMRTNSLDDTSMTSQLKWLGNLHHEIVQIAPVLMERQSSDPVLVHQLITDTHFSLNNGAL